jgi:putative PIN family toxin of toxin-antitoxin system
VIKIVLDTNVFVSGIFWSGPPHQILEAWQQRKIKLIVSEDILDEYIRVGNILEKKYHVSISPFIDLVIRHGDFFKPITLKSPVS